MNKMDHCLQAVEVLTCNGSTVNNGRGEAVKVVSCVAFES